MRKLSLNKVLAALICVLLAFFGGALLLLPTRYVGVCFDGICLWAESVLPSLFPFMVITLLLTKLGGLQRAAKPFSRLEHRLKAPQNTFVLLMISICSGYPAGSRILCEYCENGAISKADCKRLAPLLSTCGPLFALGTVGFRAFNNAAAGVKLFACCIISVVATSFIYFLLSKNQTQNTNIKPKLVASNALYDSFYGGVTACLVAGAFIAFFYTFSAVIEDFYLLSPLQKALEPPFGECSYALCKGLIEPTGGCFALASSDSFFALPLAGFLLTFGGASIILQQLCYLSRCDVKPLFFILFKFLQAAICFALLCLASLF